MSSSFILVMSSFEELIVKIVSAIFSIGAILLVLYYINKKALKKAERMNEEFMRLEGEQEKLKEDSDKVNGDKNKV
ncbi:MAG: hypothetical protein ACLFN8_02175 [Candidatus Woesearchaeota archaeon]